MNNKKILAEHDNLNDVGMFIKAVRKEQSKKQGNLAEQVKLTQAYVSRVETGYKTASFETLQIMYNELGLKLKIIVTKL